MADKKIKNKNKTSKSPATVGLMQKLPKDYPQFLNNLKNQIKQSQVKAHISVNRELILLYWNMGKQIAQKQTQEKWGTGIIERLTRDLQNSFPGMQGFSKSNIWRMRAFYKAYSREGQKLAQPVRELEKSEPPQIVTQIPWGQNVLIFEKIKNREEKLWYASQALKNGWSRAVLWHQIDSNLYNRQAGLIKSTNFLTALSKPQSDLAQEMIKDPYNFDFLTLTSDAEEKELEKGLTNHIQKFLIELGKGFAFVGSQYHLEIGDEDFYIDLLFYHLHLRCYIVIDLKMTKFKPEHSGKMNFYLSAVDDLLKRPEDNPSIGIILCKTKNKTIAEYSLRDTNKPIGISGYRLTEALPNKLKTSLPTIEELEKELGS